MKAYVLHGIADLRYEEVPFPDCPAGWGVVKVKAAGVCSSDVPRIMRRGTYRFPTIPGHEFSGIVECVADRRYRRLVGKKVAVFPLIPCRKCFQCMAGHYEMCSNYDYLGSRRNGGFAEYAAVPVWNMAELPDEISYTSAAMMEPLSVALHAVKRAGEMRTKSVTVIGSGVIGIMSAIWAKHRGAYKVYVAGRNEDKRPFVERYSEIVYGVSQEMC